MTHEKASRNTRGRVCWVLSCGAVQCGMMPYRTYLAGEEGGHLGLQLLRDLGHEGVVLAQHNLTAAQA